MFWQKNGATINHGIYFILRMGFFFHKQNIRLYSIPQLFYWFCYVYTYSYPIFRCGQNKGCWNHTLVFLRYLFTMIMSQVSNTLNVSSIFHPRQIKHLKASRYWHATYELLHECWYQYHLALRGRGGEDEVIDWRFKWIVRPWGPALIAPALRGRGGEDEVIEGSNE